MAKKKLSLFTALFMLISLVSGCGTQASPESVQSAPAQTTSAPAEEEAPVSTPDAEPQPSVEEAPEELDEPPVVIEYPISDGSVTFTLWTEMLGLFSSEMADWNENICLPYAEEATGIHENVITVTDTAASEQFSLMIASGDWPDFMNAAQYYVGGLAQAYADDVIIDISEEQLDAHMPDYQAYRKNWNEATNAYTTEGGHILSIFQIFSEPVTDRGVVVRNDWLEELRLDVPKTLPEFTEVLLAFHENYDSTYTYDVGKGAQLQYLNDAFDTDIIDITGSDLNVYVTDDQVHTALNSAGYRNYVEWFAEMYAAGVFNPDFATEGAHMGPGVYGLIADGSCGMWETRADSINDPNWFMDEPIAPVAIPMITGEDGFNNWASSPLYVKEGGFSITSSCENPELLLEYFNYFFTEPGILLANYGLEGTTFNYDAAGKPVYTEKITQPENLNFTNSINVFTMGSLVPFWADQNRYWDYYDEDIVNAKNVWSDMSNCSVDHEYPDRAKLTSEESDAITLRVVDIMTYAGEQLLKFLTGADPLTDQNWQDYVNTLETMGLSECLGVYQNAYNEYLSGIR